MAFKEGDPKPENSGRVKGTPNKRSQLVELAHEHDADPFMFLIHVMKGDGEQFLDKWKEPMEFKFETRMDAAKELMPYLYGKRRPVDSNGDDTTDIFTMLLNVADANK